MNPPSLSSLTLALFWCQPALTQHVVTRWVVIMSPLKDMPTWHTCWSLWQEGVSCSSWRCGSDDHFLPLSVCSDLFRWHHRQFHFSCFPQGGYNLTSISDSMTMCTSMLLGDPPPSLGTPLPHPHHCAVATINEVIRHHSPYWKSLRIQSKYRDLFYIGHFVCFFFFVCFSVVLFVQFQHQCEHHCPPWSIVGNVAPKEKTGSQRQAARTIQ